MRQLIDTLINGPARYTQLHHLSPVMTLVVVLGALLAEFISVYLIGLLLVKIAQGIRPFIGVMLRRFGVDGQEVPQVFLELSFPSDTSKSAFATEQLHILLQGRTGYRHFWDRLAGRKRLYSLELVSTKNDGIRYVMVVRADEVDYIQRSLRSYLPGVKIKETSDYTSLTPGTNVGVVELRLTADFVLPLQDHSLLGEHDPIAYITGHMTKLAPDELVAFQIVATPVLRDTHHRILRRAQQIQRRIALGKETTSQLISQRTGYEHLWWLLWYPPLWLIATFARFFTGMVGILSMITSKNGDLPEFMRSDKGPQASLNPYAQEIGVSIKGKLSQHLFEVSIRVLVAAPDKNVIENRISALISSFEPFTNGRQSIAPRRFISLFSPDDHLLQRFRGRILSPHFLDQQTVLSGSELSSLYHFPETDLTKTEGLVKSRSPELPTPLSIKHGDARLDVIVGLNPHGGEEQPIGMSLEQRQKHTYVIGKTGTGKTTLLASSIYQDMVSGKGLAVLDPHGDMFQELLAIVPAHRRGDVIVFDPSDRDWPIGLNLLDPGIEFQDDDERCDRITSSVLSVFAKLADKNQWGPRMEHILRNATMTALQLPNPSLYTLQRLLTDKKYQKTVAAGLKDPVLKQFWNKEFKLLGSMQLSTVTAPLTHRLGHFMTTKLSRHILLQAKSSIRIADIMDEGKILLVNLSKGDIGEDQSRFFGTILTSFIWMAAYQRTKIPERERRDFFLYVDEFQNFASPDFSEIVSEGRKYHISLVVSHQSIAQIEDKSIVKLVAGNASTLICLKVSPEDEDFILPYMKPEVTKGDIVNLAPYHFYIKTTSDVSEDAFSGQTVPLDVEASNETKEAVVAYSRQQYGTAKATVEKYMDTLFANNLENKAAPKATKETAQTPERPKDKVSKEIQGG